MSAPRPANRLRAGDVMGSAVFVLRLAWRADRGSLLVVLGVQLATAVGVAGVLLLVRGLAGDAVTLGRGQAGAGGGTGRIIPVIAAMVALRSVGGILRAAATARQRVLAVRLDRHVTDLVLGAATRAELPHFEDAAFHDRLQRAVFASRGQPVVVITTLVAVAQAVLTGAAVSVAFLAMAWWLLPFAAVSALPTLRAAHAERNASYGLSHDLAENRRVRQYLERLMTGRDEAKEVRALGLGPLLRERWHGRYAEEVDGTVRTQRRHLRRKAVARLAGDAVVVAVIGAVWWLMDARLVDLPTALAALTGLWLLSTRVQMVGGLLGNVGDSILYLKDLRAFAGPSVAAAPAGGEGPAVFASLEARGLRFRYPGSAAPVLNGVDVAFRQGEIIALVGGNGSGKTTLAKILAGLYPPESGTLLLNGAPVDDPARLRETSAVVFQDFVRYRLPVLDNIAFGRPGQAADPDRAAGSARRAGADAFVERLPRGYGTVLSKEFRDGEDLSGGQWQRLALARAFYRDAPFVILDEPTAALDPQAEEELFGRMRELFAGRTVLLISHRFSSVRGADRIYVLDGGSVVEHGTHEQLMGRRGRYAAMFLTQAAAYLDAETAVT
ncbi:ABC transporter ATP-binding protein [Actinomadura rubrisoli]|uniref:ABC transporter ATP-binding protein n=1 Tax=Actinomadura rubrisoli TaxID=2530368 RepID=A0A4R5ASU2_9ACTN|nr:ABC transporter ATP-binding protein [Actinomadura rubrisoli]TDD73502.1 ABC transporter ATP-binding protein [Actinomadura rubrisoli]